MTRRDHNHIFIIDQVERRDLVDNRRNPVKRTPQVLTRRWPVRSSCCEDQIRRGREMKKNEFEEIHQQAGRRQLVTCTHTRINPSQSTNSQCLATSHRIAICTSSHWSSSCSTRRSRRTEPSRIEPYLPQSGSTPSHIEGGGIINTSDWLKGVMALRKRAEKKRWKL